MDYCLGLPLRPHLAELSQPAFAPTVRTIENLPLGFLGGGDTQGRGGRLESQNEHSNVSETSTEQAFGQKPCFHGQEWG